MMFVVLRGQIQKKRESMVYVEMDPLAAETWRLDPVVELIKEGAVGVIPTDTVYAAVPRPFLLFCFLLLPVLLKPIACFVLFQTCVFFLEVRISKV